MMNINDIYDQIGEDKGGGDEDIERGLRKFLDTRKGESEKLGGGLRKFVYFKTNRRGELLKN